MNHSNNLLRTAALATFSILALATSPAARAARAFQPATTMAASGSVTVKNAGPYVQIGSYRIWVSSHLGRPSHVLPNGDWAFDGYSVSDTEVAGSLIVSFTNGRVTTLRLVSPAMLAALRSSPKPGAQNELASR